MDLWQLRTFQVVSRVLHFTRASEELNLSQPAVSHQMKSLEAELGETLFVRSRNGISLTPAGLLVLKHANEILHLADEMKLELEDRPQDSVGAVKLSAVLRFLENPFANVYRDFKKEHPDIELSFQHKSDASAVVTSVLYGDADAGFMATQRPQSELFTNIELGRIKMMFVVGRDHRLAKRDSVGPRDVINENWALFEESDDLRATIDNSLAEAGIAPKSVYSTNDGSVISDLVASGEFVSVLPSYGISRSLSEGKLLNVPYAELEYDLPLYLFWRPQNQSSGVESFIQFIVEYELPGIEKKK